ncbi:Hemolysin-related protein RbmC [Labilithrix luteola]|uniref:Hemolysin-related protein RbmC n=1 Tax=Labilithrix luteola TaxID=1391654 RepID=A0A0K1Q3L3_9BACT|nr:Hemolysin-related protein RbmC [Labilithrix luteola]
MGLVSLPLLAVAAASCGDSTPASTTPAGADSATDDASTSTGGNDGGGADVFDGGPNCTDGTSCGDGGVCVNGACCATGIACGDACCGAGDVCNFQKCEKPGSECVDTTDCAEGFFCDYSLGTPADTGAGGGACMAGAAQQKGKCLSLPPNCAPNADPGTSAACLSKCEYKPATDDWKPVQKYSWGGVANGYPNDVVMAPIVINLDDDNCDGRVNRNDIPEIVFSSFASGAYFKRGTLRAISIVGGELVEKWSRPNAVQPSGGLAAADLDGDGVPEIVGCMDPGPSGTSCCDAIAQNTGVVAFRADGTNFWTQTDTTQVHCGTESPVIADFDQDGNPEVLVGWTILDGKTGAVKKVVDPSNTVNSWGVKLTGVADLDGDGKLDITDGQRAYRADGTVIWDLSTGTNTVVKGYHAIGDFDKDGKPEVVIVSSAGPHTMQLVKYDPMSASGARVIRKGIDINNGVSTKTTCGGASEYGGGAPTVADFDGDGTPDVGAAGAVGYVVFSGAKMMDPNVADNALVLWSKPTHDCSSGVTGSSAFDFNGDGKAEALYSDEHHFSMFDGVTGQNLIPTTCNTSGTFWEYPVVADVDNDGQADIIVASNAYGMTCPDDGSKQSGIRVFGSASGSWTRTRRIWNEHTYHVTNVSEDGKVPAVEPSNWAQPGLNDYRFNRQSGSAFAAPDVVVRVAPQCSGAYGMVATVRNVGNAPLPAGVAVAFYTGTAPNGTLLGASSTTKALYPAEAENVVLPLPDAPGAVTNGTTPVYAVVDDANPTHAWHECRQDNNTSSSVSGKCDIGK